MMEEKGDSSGEDRKDDPITLPPGLEFFEQKISAAAGMFNINVSVTAEQKNIIYLVEMPGNIN